MGTNQPVSPCAKTLSACLNPSQEALTRSSQRAEAGHRVLLEAVFQELICSFQRVRFIRVEIAVAHKEQEGSEKVGERAVVGEETSSEGGVGRWSEV